MAKTAPTANALFAALSATWPPTATEKRNGWIIRNGAGGGKRVSAATREESAARIADAEAAMKALNQSLLFSLRPEEDDLDADLASLGYRTVDPTRIMVASPEAMAPSSATSGQCITADLRLRAMEDIWATGGIGPARLAVMDRVQRPKTFLLIRDGDAPAATGFVALHERIAMLHALEVAPTHRRRGIGVLATMTAAMWARDVGADVLALAVTQANEGARTLYSRLGFRDVTGYHYRIKDKESAA